MKFKVQTHDLLYKISVCDLGFMVLNRLGWGLKQFWSYIYHHPSLTWGTCAQDAKFCTGRSCIVSPGTPVCAHGLTISSIQVKYSFEMAIKPKSLHLFLYLSSYQI